MQFADLFDGSIYFFQNDVKSFTEKTYYKRLDDKLCLEKQKEGFAPMYTVNSFYTDKNKIEQAHERYKKERGLDRIPSTPRFKENLKTLQACFLDIDLKKEGESKNIQAMKREVINKLKKIECPPQAIVSTKNGVQVLWRLLEQEITEDLLDMYTATEEGLIEWSMHALGSMGDKVKDVCRYFRLPNYYHLKNPQEPVKVTWEYNPCPFYELSKLHSYVKDFIPSKKITTPYEFKPLDFEAYDSFDLAEAVNSHVDIKEVVPLAFRAVGVGFEVASDGYRWIIDGRLTGTFFNKQNDNFVASSSAEDYYSGPPFAVVVQIFDRYATRKEGAKWLNSVYGERLRKYTSKPVEKIDNSKKEDFLEQRKKKLLARDYKQNYSWMIEGLDKLGGLITRGRFCIVGGMHGVGKSIYMAELAKHNATSKKICFMPLEMGEDIMRTALEVNEYNREVSRLFDYEEGILPQYLEIGDIDEGWLQYMPEKVQNLYFDKMEQLYNKYKDTLYIPDITELTFANVIAQIEAHHALGCELFIIDHLHQLIVEGDSETQFYSHVAKELNNIAKKLNIAIVSVVQLTKDANSGNDKLNLSSFKGTSEFTSNAHRVLVISKKPVDIPNKRKIKEAIMKLGEYSSERDIPEEAIEEKKKEMIAMQEDDSVRIFNFLKSRGRAGGSLSVQIKAGKYIINNN